jgi:hypothetical protein
MRLILAIALMLAALPATAAEHQHQMKPPPPSACAEATLACADKATPFLAQDGALWLAWSANGRVAVSRSQDMGRSFAAPVFVNAQVEKLDGGPDGRPQIVVDGAGRATVAYAIWKDANFNGQVLIARTADGKTFTAPQSLTDSKASQRFVAFGLGAEGDVFAAWIDKRNLAAAKAAKKPYAGAALAFAWAKPGGDFTAAEIAQDNTCECCRIGVALAGANPAVIWRNLFSGGVRDHAVMTFAGGKPGPVHRVAVDDWQVDGCPHHGPSLTISAPGTYHATWFTDGKARQGLFYARSTDGGRTFSSPVPVGDVERQPSRPYVLAAGGAIWIAWKEFDGEKSFVMAKVSHDDGVTWSPAKSVAETGDASDHPLLIGAKDKAYLSWLTRHEGYRLVALENVR